MSGNRYPGAQCDIESYIYMPLIEELGFMPTEKYARAKELLKHSELYVVATAEPTDLSFK
jgi:hypothetical protein